MNISEYNVDKMARQIIQPLKVDIAIIYDCDKRFTFSFGDLNRMGAHLDSVLTLKIRVYTILQGNSQSPTISSKTVQQLLKKILLYHL